MVTHNSIKKKNSITIQKIKTIEQKYNIIFYIDKENLVHK